MVVATYFYYEMVRRTMRTAIVSKLKALVFVKITSNKLRELRRLIQRDIWFD